MFKRAYQIVLGVYTVLLIAKALSISIAKVHGFMSLGFGKMILALVHNTSAVISSYASTIF